MGYTWGYIKENTLSKLNINEEQANDQGFLSRFPYYANEAMTQICSSVRANEKFFQFDVFDKNEAWRKCTHEFGVYLDELYPISQNDADLDEESPDYDTYVSFWEKWNSLHFIDELINFPDDFINFSDDAAYCQEAPLCLQGKPIFRKEFKSVGDEYIEYVGYRNVRCHKPGTYRIPYKARWFFFTKETQNDELVDAPDDVCDAIPSYIVSQCLRVDDEVRAQVFRNEYELFLARIDDTSFKAQRTFHIGGGW